MTKRGFDALVRVDEIAEFFEKNGVRKKSIRQKVKSSAGHAAGTVAGNSIRIQGAI